MTLLERATDVQSGDGWTAGLSAVERAVVEALAYADVFDWPLTLPEIHRYLPVPASSADVHAALDPASPAGQYVRHAGEFAMLRGRGGLDEVRRQRDAVSAQLWPRALASARLVGRLPFVRMVAITGSLAARAARAGDDVDLLVVVEDGRVWLTRALIMALVRASSLRGLRLCPNFLLAESALRLSERSLFTARELVQMVPVVGERVYAELMAENAWYREFLPNAEPHTVADDRRHTGRGRVPAIVEALLRSDAADRFERWEMDRKTRRLRETSASSETRYDATCCKGHADEHGRHVLAAFEARLTRLDEVN